MSASDRNVWLMIMGFVTTAFAAMVLFTKLLTDPISYKLALLEAEHEQLVERVNDDHRTGGGF